MLPTALSFTPWPGVTRPSRKPDAPVWLAALDGRLKGGHDVGKVVMFRHESEKLSLARTGCQKAAFVAPNPQSPIVNRKNSDP
jgi:hypothetical protein